MKKTCIDCMRFNRVCLGGPICESFEWKDKRIEAGEFAVRVLWRLAHECYYKSDGTPPMYYVLEDDMKSDYETCLDIMGEEECNDN